MTIFTIFPACSVLDIMLLQLLNFGNQFVGKWLGSRQIRCNWATKTNSKEKPETDNHNAVVLTNGSSTNSG
jgi:hypothetical protein